MDVSDSGSFSENISISVYQSGGLVSHTRLLAQMTNEEENEGRVVALATATILMGAAALDAILSEAAYVMKMELYLEGKKTEKEKRVKQKKRKKQNYLQCGVPDKFSRFMGHDSSEVKLLWNARIAVCHSEPDEPRSRFVGDKLSAEGAEWVIRTVEDVAREVWGDAMPDWFKESAGLG